MEYSLLNTALPPLTRRPDFETFWTETLRKTRQVPLQPQRASYGFPSPHVTVDRITFQGFDQTPIHGLFLVPTFLGREKVPCLIHYPGFGSPCGAPGDFMAWVLMGVAVLSVDCREQNGRTGNRASYSSGEGLSVACKGILDKDEYYYRAVYMDCVKAIDFACAQDQVDPRKIIIEGGSQGGALGMAVCALDSRPWLAMVDVPGHSQIEQRVRGAHGSFSAVTEYLGTHPDEADRVFETLSYFDTMNMADWIKCEVLASVALRDSICPASCYMATYHRITTSKTLKVYPPNGHEGGGAVHHEVKLRFLAEHLRLGPTAT